MRMQSFSATQCVIFSCALLNRLNAAAFISFFVIRSLKFCTIKTHQQSLEMKIYRTASKSVIKTNRVQKVFFCLRIDSLSFSSIASHSLHFKEILEDINRRVHKEIYISVIEYELFAQSNHRSMAKLLILAALLFFSSKTGVGSVGTTTSPQQ